MIYLCSNTAFKGVYHLNLCALEFKNFSINLGDFDALIITSKNAINALEFNQIPPNDEICVFAIGKSTANAAKGYGFKNIYEGQNSHGDDFAQEIAPLLTKQNEANKKCLLLSPKEQVSDIKGILEHEKISLTQIIAYENKTTQNPPKLEFKPNDIFIFTSPKNARAFLTHFKWQSEFRAIAIGKSTANALLGITCPLISQSQSIEACINLAKELNSRI